MIWYEGIFPIGKEKFQLKEGLTSSSQNPIFHWVRDHKVHHRFSEKDADPHNARRGLFFSHVGWLMQKKHPEVVRRGKVVDMSDILADPVVQFQEK
jgi:stearoyl-CoA desaturase (delta-9 desaturase)